jgi:hypothetical protein
MYLCLSAISPLSSLLSFSCKEMSVSLSLSLSLSISFLLSLLLQKLIFLCAFILSPLTAIIGEKITIIGIMSIITDPNCSTDYPSGFFRVSDQLDWIQQNTDVNEWECNKG